MAERFKLVGQQVVYREYRQSSNEEELRWVITKDGYEDLESKRCFSRSILRHPGVAAIVPISARGEVYLIEQYRYTAERVLWEIPAGMLKGKLQDFKMVPQETPIEAAHRELREEAGFEAEQFLQVSRFYTMPGTSDGLVHLFLALNLSPSPLSPDVGEVVTRVQPFSLDIALKMIADEEITDAKTILGIYAARDYILGREL